MNATLGVEATAFRGFMERQVALYRRYWVWEVVWLVYSVVSVLSIGYLASGLGDLGGSAATVRHAQLYLLAGSLLWQFLVLAYHETSFAIAWERWEGTIEYTFMAPVSRVTHLLSISIFSLLYGLARTLVILVAVAFAIHVDLSQADVAGLLAVLSAAVLALVGLGIWTAILPLISPEKGEQMTYAVQGVLLLISGVYYSLSVLPAPLQALGHLSPLTYTLDGMRSALINHTGPATLFPEIATLLGMGVVLLGSGVVAFAAAERRAKRLGLLKRSG